MLLLIKLIVCLNDNICDAPSQEISPIEIMLSTNTFLNNQKYTTWYSELFLTKVLYKVS